MDVERINYLIKYYLKIYDGRKKPTYERVKNDIPFSDLTSQQQEEVRNNSEIYYIIN